MDHLKNDNESVTVRNLEKQPKIRNSVRRHEQRGKR